ncbi:DNA-binding GntR family transcriptional regulator [Clostridiales Family XIII bacterium PM5-7]
MEFYIGTMDLAIQAENIVMYHKQQYIFHQTYIDKCGNSELIEHLEKLKNKLLKKRYENSQEAETKEVLRDTNEEHRHILALFRQKNKEELSRFISETHWKPVYAKYDVIK